VNCNKYKVIPALKVIARAPPKPILSCLWSLWVIKNRPSKRRHLVESYIIKKVRWQSAPKQYNPQNCCTSSETNIVFNFILRKSLRKI
jgi:hypothetical protein